MLLSEIINEAIFSKHPAALDMYTSGKYQHEIVPDIERSIIESPLGSSSIPVVLSEPDLEQMKQYNINVNKIPTKIPVVYAFTLNKASEDAKAFMDAIKGRLPRDKNTPRSYMSVENRKQLIKAGVLKLLNNDKYPEQLKWKKSSTHSGIAAFMNTITQQDCVIITLASSSTVAREFASALGNEIKAPVLPDSVLIKQDPKLHGQSNQQTATDKRSLIQQSIDEIISEIKQIEQQIDKHPSDVKLNRPLMKKQQSLQVKLEKQQERLGRTKTSISNIDPRFTPDVRKRLYGNFKLNPQFANAAHNKNILLVDDNVVNGYSMADAVKAIYSMGAQPINIVGVCLHKYTSDKNAP